MDILTAFNTPWYDRVDWKLVLIGICILLGLYTLIWFGTQRGALKHEWDEQEAQDARARSMEVHPSNQIRKNYRHFLDDKTYAEQTAQFEQDIRRFEQMEVPPETPRMPRQRSLTDDIFNPKENT